MMAEEKAELISPSSALLKGFVIIWEKESQKISLPLALSAGEEVAEHLGAVTVQDHSTLPPP